MPIPKDILSVKRPRNTVVIAYGKNKQLFAVRQRVGCENRNGRHVPINGPTIGHIINNEYVPIDNEAPVPVSQAPVDIKDWADIILCDELFKDVQDELLKVYDTKDAMKIYNIAILRVCQHGIKDSELKEAYETSFLS
ncbi:MAG: transposase, partial [Oribacterium sp.]|nr:transposase [Oribacterium sp.]